MSPEGLNKDERIIGKSDVYSFAVTVLFLVFTVEFALKIMYIPISSNFQEVHKSLSSCSMLLQIMKSLHKDPEKRTNFESWTTYLKKIKNSDNDFVEKIGFEKLEKSGLDLSFLNKAVEEQAGIYFYLLDCYNFDPRSSVFNKKSAFKLSRAVSQISKFIF